MLSYNNGVSETRAYNNDNTLASISFSGASIGNLSYGWDANKNKTSEGITGTMSGYGFDVGVSGYDDEDRLVSWERDDSNLDQSWNLSLVGDWNSYTENASVQNRTHGDTHELLTVAGQAVTHDAKGNQTVIPAILRPGSDPLAMKWDFENKLISADTDNDSVADVTYQWDALGRRVGRDDGTTVTVFVQSGQQTIADYTSGTAASSPTYDYVYASYIDEPVMRSGAGGNRYYHRNQQYSIIALTNGSGAIQERYAYDAYGGLTILSSSLSPLATSAEGNRYTYTGREFDEALDLYHYRARMYDSATGRFCSRDPIGFEGSPWNLYEYVSSMPLDNSDPYGLQGHPGSNPRPGVGGAGCNKTVEPGCVDRCKQNWKGGRPCRGTECRSRDNHCNASCNRCLTPCEQKCYDRHVANCVGRRTTVYVLVLVPSACTGNPVAVWVATTIYLGSVKACTDNYLYCVQDSCGGFGGSDASKQ
jgi:RHS repeat-associated protein